jgi:hypothetical protein
MPLTGQIGGDEVGRGRFPAEAHLCNTAADSVGVVDDDGESAPAEDPLGLVASPGSQQKQIDSQTPEFGRFPEPSSGGGAGALRPAKDADLRRARLREWHDRTMEGRASTARATSFKPAHCRSDQSTGIDSSSVDMLD